MNYSLDNLPYSGEYPCVFMEIVLKGVVIGKLYVRLFREIFPAGVENFVKIIQGVTAKQQTKSIGDYIYTKNITRSYQNCKFYECDFNNIIISGDIYTNDGSDAGTIYSDNPIPSLLGNYFYPHKNKGLISLVPYVDSNGNKLYDSTFSITLDFPNNNNKISNLDNDQVVIGQVYSGLEIIDKINNMLVPFAGRKYPIFSIGKCGMIKRGVPITYTPIYRNNLNRSILLNTKR